MKRFLARDSFQHQAATVVANDPAEDMCLLGVPGSRAACARGEKCVDLRPDVLAVIAFLALS